MGVRKIPIQNSNCGKSDDIQTWKNYKGLYLNELECIVYHMKNVGVIFYKNGKGGSRYSQLIIDAVENDFNIETYEIIPSPKRWPYNYIKLLKMSGYKDVWIRASNSIITLPFDNTDGKNVAIIHHIDNSLKPIPLKILSNISDKIMIRNLNLVDKIVVVSQYWKKYFEKLGFVSTEVIYNPFNPKDFEFSDHDIYEFKKRYHLLEKPIIYLGNCQKAKGVFESYEALKGLNAYLVTSGARDVDLPVVHLDVNYRDYLLLLQASSVAVTMSKFNEGWCRTAHEAMICKTPVVGSGLGGMEELLNGGNQIICHDFSELRDDVESAMDDQKLGDLGYKFATMDQFTLRSFKEKWRNLIHGL